MVYLVINAEILPYKMNEFNQSKLSFIENIQKIEGYIGFKEKSGNYFNMKIGWTNNSSLKRFMDTELYKYFHGAVITLSESHSIDIIKTKEANDFTNV